MTPPAPETPPRLLRTRYFAAACAGLLGLGGLLYGFTLPFPFEFDDHLYLVNNPLLRDARSFLWQGDFARFATRARDLGLDPDLSTNFILRPVTYLTFYLNYLADGLNPRGFRAVNILIHGFNACLLLALLRQLLTLARRRMPLAAGSVDFIALGTALLFLVHPLQIESVTYIVQRFTSLGTLFYLAVGLTFLLGHPAAQRPRARGWRALSVGLFGVGLLAKEILFTAPVLLVLLDRVVLGTAWRAALRRVWPYALGLPLLPALIWCTAAAQQTGGPAGLGAALTIAQGSGPSPWHYALTQASVVLSYLRLLLAPVGLNLDPAYPLSTALGQPRVLWSAGALLALFGALAYGYRRRDRDLRYALLSLGGLWYFLTLAVDSSLVPLPDLMAEHRTYLPSVGFFLALACAVDLGRTRGPPSRRWLAPLGLGVLAAVYAGATGLRNETWRSEISLWRDTVAKSPGKIRPLLNLGTVYFEGGQTDAAIGCFRKVIALHPEVFVAYHNLGHVYNTLGRHQEACVTLLAGTEVAPRNADLHFELGKAYFGLGAHELAAERFRQVVALRPDHRVAHLILSQCYAQRQRLEPAREHLRRATALGPPLEGALGALAAQLEAALAVPGAAHSQ